MPKYGPPKDHVAKAHAERMRAEARAGLRPWRHEYKPAEKVYRMAIEELAEFFGDISDAD